MPVYAAGKAIALYPGDQGLAFGTVAPYASAPTGEAQSVASTGTASQAFAISTNVNIPDNAPSLSLSLIFSGNPGAFTYSIQTADQDAAANYITIPTAGTVTTAVNQSGSTYVALASWVGVIKAQFVRLLVTTQTANIVTVIATFTR